MAGGKTEEISVTSEPLSETEDHVERCRRPSRRKNLAEKETAIEKILQDRDNEQAVRACYFATGARTLNFFGIKPWRAAREAFE